MVSPVLSKGLDQRSPKFLSKRNSLMLELQPQTSITWRQYGRKRPFQDLLGCIRSSVHLDLVSVISASCSCWWQMKKWFNKERKGKLNMEVLTQKCHSNKAHHSLFIPFCLFPSQTWPQRQLFSVLWCSCTGFPGN